MDKVEELQIPEADQDQSVRKLSLKVQLSILGTIVLALGLFGTILLAQQPQDQRSKAAEIPNVTWTNAVKATIDSSTIKKTATTNAWDAGARSVETISSGDAYAQVTITDTIGEYRMFGLNNTNTTAGYTDIDYAIYFRANGALEIYENGSYKLGALTYALGDTFTIAVTNKVARYYKNGVLFYISSRAAVYPLFVDVSLYSARTQFTNGKLIAGTYAAAPTNIALNQVVTASSTYSTSYTAAKAFDGSLSTRWNAKSGLTTNQWLRVDFGTAKTYNNVLVQETYAARVKSHKLQYSNDGVNFTDIPGTGGTTMGSYKYFTFAPVTSRYMRVYFGSSSPYEPTINEISVYEYAVVPTAASEPTGTLPTNTLIPTNPSEPTAGPTATSIPATPTSDPNNVSTVSFGALTTIATPSLGGFPAMHKDVGGNIWISYQASTDSTSSTQTMGLLYQKAGQSTWSAKSQSVHLGSAGLWTGEQDIALFERASKTAARTASIKVYTLTKNATTWTARTGKMTLNKDLRDWPYIYMNNGVLNIDGTFYTPYYAGFKEDTAGGNRSELATSTDGLNWTTKSTIFKPYKTTGGVVTFSETALLNLGNGVLYAVARQEVNINGTYLPPAYAISTDYGQTWSQPQNITFGGKNIEQAVQPKLFQIAPNRYALLTGRLDNYLFIGVRNGNNISWTSRSLVFSNYNTKNRRLGSSGYMGGVVTSSGSNYANLLLTFDSCAPGWGCQTVSGGSYTYSKIYRIMTRTAAVSW